MIDACSRVLQSTASPPSEQAIAELMKRNNDIVRVMECQLMVDFLKK